MRFGSPKLRAPFDGRPLIARALDACAGHETVVVASPELVPEVPAAPARRVVVNAEPERGMSHSLRCALRAIAPEDAVVVVLGDMPFVDGQLIERVIAAGHDADVVVPTYEGRPVHPVLFGPRARVRLEVLGDGDTIRSVRDAPGLVRNELVLTDPRVALDIDLPADLERASSQAVSWSCGGDCGRAT